MKRQAFLGSRTLGTYWRGTLWSREKELLPSSPTKTISMGKVTWRKVYEPLNSEKLRPVITKVAMEQESGFLFLLLTSSTVLLEKSRITQDFRVGTLGPFFLPKVCTTLTSTGSASAWPDLFSHIWPP